YRFTKDWLRPDDQYLKDRYVVYWGFGEECQYRGSGRDSVTGWFLEDGTPCLDNHYDVTVVITPELRPERIDIHQRLSFLTGPNVLIRRSQEQSSKVRVGGP